MNDGRRINRREAVKKSAAAAALAAGGMALKRSSSPPNIIFILTDDHRWDAFGCLGKPWLKTPNLDRLFREGVHFENGFVTTSLCSPSRASFLTGKYARCHGVMNNLTPWREDNLTFLEILHARGYRTAFIGKWHMPGKGLPDLTGQGKVDRMVSFSIATGQGIYFNCPLVVDGKKQKSKGYITDVLTDYALEFLSEPSPKPFLLYLSHKAVHHNFSPPPRYEGALKGVSLHPMEERVRDLPTGLIQEPQRRNFERNQRRYYEALLAVDESVGRVLEFLDDRGLSENTLVVYAGDNGYFWGEHGLIDKRYAYEEGIRIPCLARFPRLAPEGGRKVSEMVLNIDLMPSLLEAAGVPAPPGVQGRSWLPLIQGRRVPWRTAFLYEYFKDPGFPIPEIKAVRTEDWKLITYPRDRERFPDELYHLAQDPGERRDLSTEPAFRQKKEELEKLLARLDRELDCKT